MVTGATKGIGRAISECLTRDGYQVVGMARHPVDDFPGEQVVVDLLDADALEIAIEEVLRSGPVAGLVNNASVASVATIGAVQLADLDALLALNVRAPLQLVQGFLASVRSVGGGRIVNVSTIVADGGWPGRTAYSAAKAGLEAMTRTWAVELAVDDVTVNAVAPGPVRTALFAERNPPGSETERAWIDIVPMGRPAADDDVAGCVSFLCSDDARYVTGQVLGVDGGARVARVAPMGPTRSG